MQVADSDHGDAGDVDHSDVGDGGSVSDLTRSGDDDASVELKEALRVSQAQIRDLTEKLQRVQSENAALVAEVSSCRVLWDICACSHFVEERVCVLQPQVAHLCFDV